MKFVINSLLVLLVVLSFQVSAKESKRNSFEISLENLNSLYNTNVNRFSNENYDLSCFQLDIFNDQSKLFVNDKENDDLKSLIDSKSIHQCQIVSKDNTLKGEALFLSNKFEDETYLAGFISIAGETYYLPLVSEKLSSFEGVVKFPKVISHQQKELNFVDDVINVKKNNLVYELVESKNVAKDKNSIRLMTIDIETDAEFLEQFKLVADRDYRLALTRALLYIEFIYAQASMIQTKDFGVAIKLGHIYLYTKTDRWVSDNMNAQLREISSFYRGSGLVLLESLSEDIVRVPGLPIVIDSGHEAVFALDRRVGSGIRSARFNKVVSLVQLLSGKEIPDGVLGVAFFEHPDNRGRLRTNLGDPVYGYSIARTPFILPGFSLSRYIYLEDLVDQSERIEIPLRQLITPTHELGHGFGLLHTHTREIDECACDDDPSTAVNECDRFVAEDEVGFIMSYCNRVVLKHDQPATQLVREAINRISDEFKASHLPLVDNQAPTIRRIIAPEQVGNHKLYRYRVEANDENSETLLYEFRFSDGQILYTHEPEVIHGIEDYEDPTLRVSVKVYDRYFASSTSTINVINRSQVEEVSFNLKNLSSEVLNPRNILTGNEVYLSLEFFNFDGVPNVSCYFGINKEEEEVLSLYVNTLHDPEEFWDTQCLLRHRFIEPGEYRIIYAILDANMPPVRGEALILVSENQINNPPIITNINRLTDARNGIYTDVDYFDDHVESPIELGRYLVGANVGLQVDVFDEEGDEVLCQFDMGDGRSVEVVSVPTPRGIQYRRCQFHYIYQEIGRRQIVISAYHYQDIIVTRQSARGMSLPVLEQRRVFDIVDGVSWLNLELVR